MEKESARKLPLLGSAQSALGHSLPVARRRGVCAEPEAGAGRVTIAAGKAVIGALLVIITLVGYEPSVNGLAITGLVIMGCCALYDAIHAPVVTVRHNRQVGSVHAVLTPAGAVVNFRF